MDLTQKMHIQTNYRVIIHLSGPEHPNACLCANYWYSAHTSCLYTELDLQIDVQLFDKSMPPNMFLSAMVVDLH